MDPASSSSDESEVSSSSSSEDDAHPVPNAKGASISGENHDDAGSGARRYLPPTSIDDLPSDDSVSVGESDDDDKDDEDEDEKEETPIGERVQSLQQEGRRGRNGNEEARSRRSRAVALASKKLQEMRRKRKLVSPIELKGGSKKKKKSTKSSFLQEADNDPSSSNDDDGPDEGKSSEQTDPVSSKKAKKKRKKSKHAPTEVSSKRSDFFARGAPSLNSSGVGVEVGAHRYKPRDPRMVSLSGSLDEDTFERRYAFLEEVQSKEIENLKKRIAARKISGQKGKRARRRLGLTGDVCSLEEDQSELNRLVQERNERRKAQVQRAAKRAVKKKMRDEVAAGKRGVYYPKRKELKAMELEAKFDELRKRGGDKAVDRALAKRRKKNIAKDRKFMPPRES